MRSSSEEAVRKVRVPGHRGLSTARAVLQVATLLARRPEGVRADQVAQTLGKSVSTAYNLLASLCDEGVAVREPGAVYRLAPGFRRLVASGQPAPASDPAMARVVDELLSRTHKRSYLGLLEDGRLHVVLERGMQGMPRVPGLDREISDNAHALALGKVVLALSGRETVDAYLRGGLRAFTPHTVTRGEQLRAELREVRRSGIAADREEFGEDLCGLAAPILAENRRLVGVLGISMTRRGFEDEHERLEESLREVALQAGRAVRAPGFQTCADPLDLLEAAPEAPVPSPAGAPVA